MHLQHLNFQGYLEITGTQHKQWYDQASTDKVASTTESKQAQPKPKPQLLPPSISISAKTSG